MPTKVQYQHEKERIRRAIATGEPVARVRRVSNSEYGYVTKHHKPMLLFMRRGSGLQYVGTTAYISKGEQYVPPTPPTKEQKQAACKQRKEQLDSSAFAKSKTHKHSKTAA